MGNKIKPVNLSSEFLRWSTKYKPSYMNDVCASTTNITDIRISVDWKRSQLYGLNPMAHVVVVADNRCYESKSKRISGCGYCKLSTAVADALRENVAIKELLENNNDVDSPCDMGGRGISMILWSFQKMGFKTALVSSIDMYESYYIYRV